MAVRHDCGFVLSVSIRVVKKAIEVEDEGGGGGLQEAGEALVVDRRSKSRCPTDSSGMVRGGFGLSGCEMQQQLRPLCVLDAIFDGRNCDLRGQVRM